MRQKRYCLNKNKKYDNFYCMDIKCGQFFCAVRDYQTMSHLVNSVKIFRILKVVENISLHQNIINYDYLKAVKQGCPTLVLAIDCPAKFSSDSNQTHLKQLIKVFGIA